MPKGLTVTKDDATAALNALISIKVEEPSSAGQTKERLSNNEFVGELTAQVKTDFLGKDSRNGEWRPCQSDKEITRNVTH